MDISSIFQTWLNVLTKPGEEVFTAEREKSSATLKTASHLVWMILASVISALLGTLQAQIFSSPLGGVGQIMEMLPTELQGELGPITETDTPGGSFLNLSIIIFGPITFLIGVGIYHVVASVLGGRGQFGRYAYLYATFGAPIIIVGSILGFLPAVGGCLGGILGIYQVVLNYFALKVEYELSQGRAIVVVVAPLLVGLALAACLAIALVGMVASVSQ